MALLRNLPVNLKRYLPNFLTKDESINDLLEVHSEEHEKYRQLLLDALDQLFVDSATWGLSEWEETLGIYAKPTDSYEQRRNRILLKLQGHQTSTLAFMKSLVERYCSEDCHIDIVEENETYTLHIVSTNGRIVYTKDLMEAIDTYKPAHIGFSVDINRTFDMDDESSIKYGLAGLLLGSRRINPKPPDNTSLSVGYGFGDFSHGRQVINCGPVDLSNQHPIRLGLARSLNGVIRVECDTSEIPEEFRNILMPSVSGPYIGSGIFGHGYKKVRLQLPDEVVMDIHSGTALFKNGSRRTGLSVPKETEASSRIGTHNIRMGRIRVPADVSEITMGSCRNAHAGIAHAGISQAGL